MNSLTPKVPEMMCRIAVKTIEDHWKDMFFKMAGGGHFEFEYLTELAHIFTRGMGAKFLI